MRKTSNKILKTDKLKEETGKRYEQSIRTLASVPVFIPADDEEYFFETEEI
jgi:hypothetical protein